MEEQLKQENQELKERIAVQEVQVHTTKLEQ